MAVDSNFVGGQKRTDLPGISSIQPEKQSQNHRPFIILHKRMVVEGKDNQIEPEQGNVGSVSHCFGLDVNLHDRSNILQTGMMNQVIQSNGINLDLRAKSELTDKPGNIIMVPDPALDGRRRNMILVRQPIQGPLPAVKQMHDGDNRVQRIPTMISRKQQSVGECMAAIFTTISLDTDPLILLRFPKDRDGMVPEIMTVFDKIKRKAFKTKKGLKKEFFLPIIYMHFLVFFRRDTFTVYPFCFLIGKMESKS